MHTQYCTITCSNAEKWTGRRLCAHHYREDAVWNIIKTRGDAKLMYFFVRNQRTARFWRGIRKRFENSPSSLCIFWWTLIYIRIFNADTKRIQKKSAECYRGLPSFDKIILIGRKFRLIVIYKDLQLCWADSRGWLWKKHEEIEILKTRRPRSLETSRCTPSVAFLILLNSPPRVASSPISHTAMYTFPTWKRRTSFPPFCVRTFLRHMKKKTETIREFLRFSSRMRFWIPSLIVIVTHCSPIYVA